MSLSLNEWSELIFRKFRKLNCFSLHSGGWVGAVIHTYCFLPADYCKSVQKELRLSSKKRLSSMQCKALLHVYARFAIFRQREQQQLVWLSVYQCFSRQICLPLLLLCVCLCMCLLWEKGSPHMIYSCAEGPSRLSHLSTALYPSIPPVFSFLSSPSRKTSVCRV